MSFPRRRESIFGQETSKKVLESRNEPEMSFRISKPVPVVCGRLAVDEIPARGAAWRLGVRAAFWMGRRQQPLGYCLLAYVPPLPPFFWENEPNLSF